MVLASQPDQPKSGTMTQTHDDTCHPITSRWGCFNVWSSQTSLAASPMLLPNLPRIKLDIFSQPKKDKKNQTALDNFFNLTYKVYSNWKKWLCTRVVGTQAHKRLEPHFYELSVTVLSPMAMVARLHVCPQSLEPFNFKDYHRTGPTVIIGSGFRRSGSVLPTGRNGFCLKQCRSFRGEDGRDAVEEKEAESAEKRGNLKKGSGIWKSLSSTVLGGFGLRSRNSDEYRKAVAKLEEVCSSVSVVYWFSFFILRFD